MEAVRERKEKEKGKTPVWWRMKVEGGESGRGEGKGEESEDGAREDKEGKKRTRRREW